MRVWQLRLGSVTGTGTGGVLKGGEFTLVSGGLQW